MCFVFNLSSKRVAMLCKNINKNDAQISQTHILFTREHRKYQMFKQWLILNLLAVTCLKKLGWRNKKLEK